MSAGPMEGLMQRWSLTTDRIIDHAARWHADREVVSRREDGSFDRRGYADVRQDAARLSNALLAHGIGPGDRVATLAMNTVTHLAAWYAISGIGAICHTLNPRFSEDQLSYIVNHAEDRLILADGALAPLLRKLLPRFPSVERVVFFSPPVEEIPGAVALEAFVAGQGDDCAWGQFSEETAAGLCYTSGTTGEPKGVLYSHRSNFLHTLITMQPDMIGLSARDVILPAVPMFHANAWALVFSAPYVGAKLVLPGAKLDGESVFNLIRDEGVTCAAGVPTVWLGLLEHAERNGGALPPSLRRVVVGGAALPERVLRQFYDYGVEAVHAWGMTEMSPCGTLSHPTGEMAGLPFEQQLPWRLKQGRVPCGVDMRLVDDSGAVLPHDGQTMGKLQVRGPSISRRYYRQERDACGPDGFFDTGDVATIDPQGFMKITDRAKDIVKSGGEWISSIEIENVAVGHPCVSLAAVVGAPHPKWDERPLLFIQAKPDAAAEPEELRAYLAARLPKWWLPDDIRVIGAMPMGSTGKIDKKVLRTLI